MDSLHGHGESAESATDKTTDKAAEALAKRMPEIVTEARGALPLLRASASHGYHARLVYPRLCLPAHCAPALLAAAASARSDG